MADFELPLTSANDVITSLIHQSALRLEGVLGGDVLSYSGPIVPPIEERIRDALETRAEKQPKLLFILETQGGVLETVVRIVETIRHHYQCVEFIVPDHAFSAGTVLVLSGDEIYMDYFSVLGPTDPQDVLPDGTLIPALGYIERYERLVEKSRNGTITTAELAVLIQCFDQGRLQMFEHARELAKTLLKEWLPKYKFKDWTKTETRGRPVTEKMRQKRADEIADQLSDTQTWHSHGRGISMEILRRDLKLKIKDIESTQEVKAAVRSFNGLLVDFAGKMAYQTFLYTPGRLVVPFTFRL